MKKHELKEEFFKYLTETPSAGGEKISRLMEEEIRGEALTPPDALWLKIQKKISEERAAPEPGFTAKLKALFSPPVMPALALAAVGVMVGAFFLLSQGSTPQKVQLIEITANTSKRKGDVVVAQGMRIESLGAGTIARIAGNTDKIILQSGSWQMDLQHANLEKPVQFIFPGGALEPLGTAFTVAIGNNGTTVNLTEGKIRLYERGPDGKNRRKSEVTAPFQGSLSPAPVTTEIQGEPAEVVEKKKEPSSKYANYVGKDITVELKNGDRLSGKLRSAQAGVLSIAGGSGNLRIRESDVVQINRN